jgi:hypothetical protein
MVSGGSLRFSVDTSGKVLSMPLPRPGSFNRTTMSVVNGRLSADGLTGAAALRSPRLPLRLGTAPGLQRLSLNPNVNRED